MKTPGLKNVKIPNECERSMEVEVRFFNQFRGEENEIGFLYENHFDNYCCLYMSFEKSRTQSKLPPRHPS
jgi:hypothetical protein